MTTKGSKSLVIDASVARAAGGDQATFPAARFSREFLLNTLEICHRIVMNNQIKDEWKSHQSRFARTWLRSMYARRKVTVVSDEVDQPLRDSVNDLNLSDSDRAAILKDIHLIEAARTSNKTVVSLDERAKRLMIKSCSTIRKLRGLLWINPAMSPEQATNWLNARAPLPDEFLLNEPKP